MPRPPSPLHNDDLAQRWKTGLRSILPSFLWSHLRRTRDFCRKTALRITHVFRALCGNRNMESYVLHVLRPRTEVSADHVDLAGTRAEPHPQCPRTVAFYLPQFHPIPENDEWWGRGFTEWTNVTRAVPQYAGHYQPQLPIDLGFYDLRLPGTMQRQIELARLYGIHGFCFHYYWFSGRRLLEMPITRFLENRDYDMPFCLCWANEPWSRRWDGSPDSVLLEQKLETGDGRRFMRDILPFLRDPRYMTIGNRPILIIYYPHLWPRDRVLALTSTFRREAANAGLEGVYLVCGLTHAFQGTPEDWGFDAGLEFPPNRCDWVPRANGFSVANKRFHGWIQDMASLVRGLKDMSPADQATFRTVFPGWDNTPRRGDSARIFHGSTPGLYGEWLSDALRYAYDHHSKDERLVFINAWNEWAEGAHLEPDHRYGYAYLQATRDALEHFTP